MDIGAIFLLLALVMLVAFFIARPFLSRRPAPARRAAGKQQLPILQAEHERVLQALQELDFDYSLGKVPEEDYPSQRNALLQQGAEVLQKLDTLRPQPAAAQTVDQLEEALAARRKALSQAASDAATARQNEDLEVLISARRRARNGSSPREKSIGFCPHCGKPIQKSDRFCPKCGTELN